MKSNDWLKWSLMYRLNWNLMYTNVFCVGCRMFWNTSCKAME
jgi:hypothetical protein